MVTALKFHEKKGKVVDEMKDGKRVAVRKHLQSVIDKKGSQESFDASSIFLRSAKWTAHVEKSGARHRSIGHLLTVRESAGPIVIICSESVCLFWLASIHSGSRSSCSCKGVEAGKWWCELQLLVWTVVCAVGVGSGVQLQDNRC